MKSKTLAILGIGVYILSVLSSAEDLAGNYTAPTTLIVVSAIAMLAFTIMAVVRLWKTQKVTAILFLASSLITLVYVSAPIKIINFILFIWVISLLWAMAKHEEPVEKIKEKFGLTSEEFSSLQKNWQNLGSAEKLQKITDLQEKRKKLFKETT